ncbi:MAG: RnfABCDGE type electron transport complex subunit G [Oscillospiraceae bacterium]
MSKEVKTKEKIDMDPKYLLELTLKLLVVCLVVAVLLGFVNSITADKIIAFNEQKTATAMSAVVEDPASTFEPVEVTQEFIDAGLTFESGVKAVSKVMSGSNQAGYVCEVVPSGFGGDIDMVVGLDMDGAITGVSIIKNVETAGVGSKVMLNANGVLDQFVGKSAADGELVVKSNVDAISGATVSSKAVTRGVNAALSVTSLLG